MTIDIAVTISSLGNYDFVIYGDIKSEQDWNENVKFVSGADENGTAIFSDTKPVTYQQVLDKQAELQADYDAKQYQRDRAEEYPSIGDQLDYIYHNGIDAWKTDMIDPIKNKYPKDNS
jgi:hypothetical protein